VTVSRFDRVRPRTTPSDGPQTHDAQGKRALFSSVATEPATRLVESGGVEVDCSRCGETTVLARPAALRLAFPALHLGVRVRRGERATTLGLLRRRYPSWVRCPACGHTSWVRVTVRI
jgi:predicted RNA-binding Zn-ribbon protein involved in translation (DUF1610 family)